MADWPTPKQNDEPNPSLGGLTIAGPAYDDNADGSKTAQEVFVEQQWRDLEGSETAKLHPLSINRDAPEVTADPYNVP